MASLLSPSSSTLPLQHKVNRTGGNSIFSTTASNSYKNFASNGRCHARFFRLSARISVEGQVLQKQSTDDEKIDYGVVSVHHVGILCENLEKSLDFYQNILGLEINEARPHDKLPYRGAWLWVGSEMIHLMELPNPDPLTGRPAHGGRDRHTCIAIRDVSKLRAILDKAGNNHQFGLFILHLIEHDTNLHLKVFHTHLASLEGQQSLREIQMQTL